MLIYLYTIYYDDGETETSALEICSGCQVKSAGGLEYLKKASSFGDEAAAAAANEKLDDWIALKNADTRPSRLMRNILIYAIAEKHNIPHLKAFAKAKFEAVQCKHCVPDYIIPIVKKIFESTPTADMGLRTLMIEMYTTGGRVTQLSESGSHLRLIKEHEDLRFGMLESISEKAMAVINGYEEKLQSTIKERRAMKSRMLRSRKRKFGQVNTMLDKLVTQTKEIQRLDLELLTASQLRAQNITLSNRSIRLQRQIEVLKDSIQDEI